MKLETAFSVRPSLAARWLPPALFMLGLSLIVVGAATDRFVGPLTSGAIVAGACVSMFVAAMLFAFGRRMKAGMVVIEPDAITLGTSCIERHAVADARFEPATERSAAHVRLADEGDGELASIVVRDREQADAVLAALKVRGDRYRARAAFFSGESIAARLIIAVAVAALGASFSVPSLLGAVPLLLGLVALMEIRVQVGADGLAFASPVRSRFLPWSDVEGVAPFGRAIVLTLRDGKKVHLPAGRDGLEKARAALARYRESKVPDAVSRFTPGETAAEREGSFREAPLRVEDLWAIVESAAASPEARAGAAAAIAGQASREDRVRLRVAAETCAEPRLRIALENAASDDEETAATTYRAAR